MNTYATPPESRRRLSSISSTSRTTNRVEMRARPRHIADLLVVRGGSSAADWATDTSAHSSSHWAMVTPDPHADRPAPAQVKELARELGVDTCVAWEALDRMYR